MNDVGDELDRDAAGFWLMSFSQDSASDFVDYYVQDRCTSESEGTAHGGEWWRADGTGNWLMLSHGNAVALFFLRGGDPGFHDETADSIVRDIEEAAS